MFILYGACSAGIGFSIGKLISFYFIDKKY